jgi:hypothetical protein
MARWLYELWFAGNGHDSEQHLLDGTEREKDDGGGAMSDYKETNIMILLCRDFAVFGPLRQLKRGAQVISNIIEDGPFRSVHEVFRRMRSSDL